MALFINSMFWPLCSFDWYKVMKKLIFFSAFPLLFLCVHSKLESRQYNVDYLIILIEEGNEEGVRQFFSQPNYVTKLKHVVEFTEIFRSKLEERFGYKPSYKEAYDCFKANLPRMNLHKEQEKLFLSIFKELNKQFEKAEERGYHLSAVTMDYKGSLDPEIDIPNELAIAFNEALGGCLMCIIPGVVTQGIGVGMIVDSARRTYDYLEKKRPQNTQDAPYDYSDNRSASEQDNYNHSYDRDSWDKEY